MSDEQPNSPSLTVSEPDAAPAAPASEQAEEASSKSTSWWDRITGRGRREEPQPEQESAEQQQASDRLTVTTEELERRIQAETDRRESKRAQQAALQARKKLRDEDPWQYAEEERKAEQVQQSTGQLTEFFSNVGVEHDRVSIDPIVEALPPRERERILKLDGAGVGLNGRKLVVRESLKALEKQWRSEGEAAAEKKLRSNQSFRKQVLAEIRGQSVEPELLPSAGPSEADRTVSSLLRDHYRMG